MSDELQNNPHGQSKQPSGGMPPQYPPPYRYRERKSTNWWIPVIIIVAVIGLFILGGIMMIVWMGSMFEQKQISIQDNTVLYLDLSNIQEYDQPNPFAFLSDGQSSNTLLSTLTAIERAKDDERVKGIFYKATFGAPGIGMAKANEIRDALLDFKESGKFIYAYIEMANESAYYNALVADSIFMPREGFLEMNGYGVSSVFLKGLFEKLGIEWHVEAFEDFKSAGDSYRKNKFSDSARYQIQVILEQRLEAFTDAITANRGLSKDQIMNILDNGYFTADSLLKYGIIDGLIGEMDLRYFIEKKIAGQELDLVINNYEFNMDDYLNKDWQLDDEDSDSKKKSRVRFVNTGRYYMSNPPTDKQIYDKNTSIAIINGVGPIMSGRGGDNPFDSDYKIQSGDFVRYLKKAREDKNVKAIILRIDSPGGSVIASDEIWEEIIKTRKVKPVIASMSDVAASGGYYIAMACDEIIAHPMTITGSIGVVLALPNFTNTMNKLDLTVDTISTNKNSQFMNQLIPFNNETLSSLHKYGESVYHRFLHKVAHSRNMTFDEVRSLAKGRVWTGQDAYDYGLIDKMGGLKEAISSAKELIGVPDSMLVYVRTFPEREDDLKAFLKLFGIDDGSDNGAKMQKRIAKAFGNDPVKSFLNWELLPDALKKEFIYQYELSQIANREKVLMAMPYLINME